MLGFPQKPGQQQDQEPQPTVLPHGLPPPQACPPMMTPFGPECRSSLQQSTGEPVGLYMHAQQLLHPYVAGRRTPPQQPQQQQHPAHTQVPAASPTKKRRAAADPLQTSCSSGEPGVEDALRRQRQRAHSGKRQRTDKTCSQE